MVEGRDEDDRGIARRRTGTMYGWEKELSSWQMHNSRMQWHYKSSIRLYLFEQNQTDITHILCHVVNEKIAKNSHLYTLHV
jgi:hypothetical protein